MKTLHDLPAPAKLNLFLHITGRRADGYHLLQSAFMLIDWCDTIHLDARDDGQVRRHDTPAAGAGEPLPEADLCVRAALALRQATGCTLGVDITLEKRIPAQAGMGGGSSDAATCLLGLNRLWGLGLDRTALARIGLGLGADVPFFLGGTHAFVQGVGEDITPMALPAARFAVLKPPVGLATARIFGDPQLKRDTNPATIAGFAADPYGFGHNDLQPVAQRLCPEVAQALGWLREQGLQPRMTGSGSAVFAHLPAQTVLPEPPAGYQLRVCGNLDGHPLRGWWSGQDRDGK